MNRDTERAIKTLRDEIEGQDGALEDIMALVEKTVEGIKGALDKLDKLEDYASIEIESLEDEVSTLKSELKSLQ